jgi:intracellular septation protein
MQILVDFFPLLLFLGAYLYSDDIFVALQVLMVAMPASFLIKWWITRKVDKMLLGSTVILLIMGSATLIFRNPIFLYWKPTVFYWIAAIAFLASQFVGEKPIARRFFDSLGEMTTDQWRKLNLLWVLFFVGSGFLNLYVAFNFSEKFWVKFKVLGFTALSFVFIIGQVFWLMRVMKEKDPEQSEAD